MIPTLFVQLVLAASVLSSCKGEGLENPEPVLTRDGQQEFCTTISR